MCQYCFWRLYNMHTLWGPFRGFPSSSYIASCYLIILILYISYSLYTLCWHFHFATSDKTQTLIPGARCLRRRGGGAINRDPQHCTANRQQQKLRCYCAAPVSLILLVVRLACRCRGSYIRAGNVFRAMLIIFPTIRVFVNVYALRRLLIVSYLVGDGKSLCVVVR